eukprot:678445-Amphidinium_carterae.1
MATIRSLEGISNQHKVSQIQGMERLGYTLPQCHDCLRMELRAIPIEHKRLHLRDLRILSPSN